MGQKLHGSAAAGRRSSTRRQVPESAKSTTWESLRLAFIADRGSLRALAAAHAVSYRLALRRARAEGWRAARLERRDRAELRAAVSVAQRAAGRFAALPRNSPSRRLQRQALALARAANRVLAACRWV